MTAFELKPLVVSRTCLYAVFGDSGNPNYFQICTVCRAQFLNLGTIDTLGPNCCFCCGGSPVRCRMFSSNLGLCPLKASSNPSTPGMTTSVSPDITEGPWGAESPLVENHCCIPLLLYLLPSGSFPILSYTPHF